MYNFDKMKLIYVALICYYFVPIFSIGTKRPRDDDKCSIAIKTDLPKKNDPIYVVENSNNLALAVPKHGSLTLSKNQDLILACTGAHNELLKTHQPVTKTKCVVDTELSIAQLKTIISTDELNCTSRSMGSLLITKTNCGKGSHNLNTHIIETGFLIGNKLLPFIKTCNNIGLASSLWSSHVIYGSSLPYKMKSTGRPQFTNGIDELYNDFSPNQAYKKDNQAQVFGQIYGVKNAAKYINTSKQLFLARGHLAPDADFSFKSWRSATYFFVNAAPQWQTINGGNWLVLENTIRQFAIQSSTDINVITGTHNILHLPNGNNEMVPAYLHYIENDSVDNRLPVPEIFWKILHTDKNSCIVFISVNNPHLESPPTHICTDICEKTHWPVLQNNYTKGYIYCCDYNSFKDVVTELPDGIKCNTNLMFKI